MIARTLDSFFVTDRGGSHSLRQSPARFDASAMAIIQTLAILTMTLDHASIAFPLELGLRGTVGRMALPLFCFMVAYNALHTRRPGPYPWRILIIALIAQLPFAVLTGHALLANICVTLAGAAFLITGLRRRSAGYLTLAMGLCALTPGVEYGFPAYALVLAFAAACYAPPLWLFPLLVWPLMHYGATPAALFAALSTVVILGAPRSPIPWDRLPRWLTLPFYPAHLAVLCVLSSAGA
ncbi:TraX family protein [Salinicola sp. DM10]|uniref:TraX family protein n=1 Tax=Salinicola sp. DM10 TaxID=2815721 RepID=UPI001A8FC335|nr:TraX family protein [Salinicola sp. DM10]MCE3026404.1 conjugal transfer protein TraX [Salinicola sp. DM10]